jgi:hypothetical protein
MCPLADLAVPRGLEKPIEPIRRASPRPTTRPLRSHLPPPHWLCYPRGCSHDGAPRQTVLLAVLDHRTAICLPTVPGMTFAAKRRVSDGTRSDLGRDCCDARDLSTCPKPARSWASPVGIISVTASTLRHGQPCRSWRPHLVPQTPCIGPKFTLRRKPYNPIDFMVPGEGLEPPTFGLQNRCTTTVLTRPSDGPLPQRHRHDDRPRRIVSLSYSSPRHLAGRSAPSACQLSHRRGRVALPLAGVIFVPIFDFRRVVQVVDHQCGALFRAFL